MTEAALLFENGPCVETSVKKITTIIAVEYQSNRTLVGADRPKQLDDVAMATPYSFLKAPISRCSAFSDLIGGTLMATVLGYPNGCATA